MKNIRKKRENLLLFFFNTIDVKMIVLFNFYLGWKSIISRLKF